MVESDHPCGGLTQLSDSILSEEGLGIGLWIESRKGLLGSSACSYAQSCVAAATNFDI